MVSSQIYAVGTFNNPPENIDFGFIVEHQEIKQCPAKRAIPGHHGRSIKT